MRFRLILAFSSKIIFFLFLLTLAKPFSNALCYGNDLIATLEGHADFVTSVMYSPDGKTLASGSEDDTIKLWDVSARRNIATLRGHIGSVTSVMYSPDGKTLASGSEDGTIKLWDISTGHTRVLATLNGHTSGVTSVAYSPSGKTLASGSEDDTIKLWDVSARRDIDTYEGHRDEVLSVAYSPDGKILASGSRDGTIKLWDVLTGVNITTLYGHTGGEVASVAYSPDGKTLASGAGFIYPGESKGKGIIKLWDVWTGQDIAILEEEHTSWINGWIAAVAYSPDGKALASGGRDYMIKLWDVSAKRNVSTEEK